MEIDEAGEDGGARSLFLTHTHTHTYFKQLKNLKKHFSLTIRNQNQNNDFKIEYTEDQKVHCIWEQVSHL